MKFDYVVTVCDNAKENCPFFPGAEEYVHMGFPDPNSVKGNEGDKLNAFRETRLQISKWLAIQFNLEVEIKL
ncbi:MAG: hypothetical protein GPJ54_17525 [Candidatus Heimdallarchaeota archaeon]|nr:hypothetical protein [Candidatus Heimdallarchaeota archaeon]